jgi:hypothetical protein
MKDVKQDQSNCGIKFIITIRLGGKSTNRRQSSKWKGICKDYKNPISKFDVGKTSFENKRKTYRA